MSIDIKLEMSAQGYKIIRKKCLNCGADFVFRVESNFLIEKKVYDVKGNAIHNPDEKKIRCKVCLSIYKYNFI